MTDLEARVERLEAEVGVDHEDLPTFDSWDMVENVDEVHGLTIYRDSSGDGWIQYPDGEADCFMDHITGGDLIEAIKEANRD